MERNEGGGDENERMNRDNNEDGVDQKGTTGEREREREEAERTRPRERPRAQ